MKTLYIIRHAKSSWDSLSINDFERPLNERGTKDTLRMAKRLKERNITIDYMLSSPANRALTTCNGFAKILGCPQNKIQTDQHLYHADEDRILKIIQELKDQFNSVLVFAHNPGLTNFANLLLEEDIKNIPTCGIVAAELKIDLWKNAKYSCGKMGFFDYPKKNLGE